MLKVCVEITDTNASESTFSAITEYSNSALHFKKLSAAFFTSKIWNYGDTIKIGFLHREPVSPHYERYTAREMKRRSTVSGARLDPIQTDIDSMSIPEAVRHIVLSRYQPVVGMKLEFVDNASAADIRITLDPKEGSWSLIGTDCRRASGPTMNLGWFDVPTVLHEFGHALGLIHEHQNPRGNSIQWDEKKLYDWAAKTQHWTSSVTYANIVKKYSLDQVNGSLFDPESIMLYFFPGSLTLDNRGTRQNMRLSSYDVWYISQLYPGGSLSPEQAYLKYYGEPLKVSDAVKTITHNTRMTSSPRGSEFFPVVLLVIVALVALVGMRDSKS